MENALFPRPHYMGWIYSGAAICRGDMGTR